MHTHLQPNIIGNLFFVNQVADKAKFCVARSRVGDFYLFKASVDEEVEEPPLLLDGHWVREGLVPIA